MMLGFIYIGLPLIVFFGLVALPKGRPALRGVLITGALIGFIWLSYIFSIGPFFTGNARADAFMVAAAAILTGAWLVAAILQAVRGAFGPNTPGWFWPVMVIATLIGLGIPAFRILGL